MGKRKVINTGILNGMFYTDDDFKMDISIGREYLSNDIIAKILLFRVDRIKTKTNNIYGETRATEKKTLPPVELTVKMGIEDQETDYIGDSNMVKHFAGQLIFTIYEEELNEKGVNITRGDYIGFTNSKGKLTYYEVNDADTNNVSNSKTIAGLGAFYRRIVANAVDKDVFRG